MLLKKSWTVTSLIRTEEQIEDLKKISEGLPGEHRIVVHDLEQVGSQEKAAAILEQVKPDSVVFSADEQELVRTVIKIGYVFRIDRDAAIAFLRASIATPSVSHFILVSYLGARRANAPWWTAEDWEGWKKVNTTFLARYYEAKVAADEALFEEAKKRDGFTAVSVRPGGLTEKEEGGVVMGQTKKARGMTTRATTARAAALLLEREGVKTRWLDVLDGEEDIETALERCVSEGTECAEGEPIYSA
ncbi:hypothetical protein ACJ41O_001975 [Fusarium nematophilum]